MNPVENTPGGDTGTLFPVAPRTLERLHQRLAADADAAQLTDVAYTTVETPVGPLLLAATEHGLVRVAYASEGFDEVLATLAERVSPRILRSPHRLDQTAAQLREYFAGTRYRFDVPLDHRLSSGFRRTVQDSLPGIAYGRTLTYKQVAERVGNPKAVRAVGTACATNPLPVVVPCHRVLRSDGGMGGYIGGLEAKTTLLELERAA
ncbi:methylated-DNA--[protein]-cysteine S-methyltransferase [Nocardiopsis oceani]